MSVIVTPSLPTSEGVDASSNGEKMQGAPIQYRLGRRLGAGGMAEVHLCTVEGPEGFLREVAVKVVREAFAEDARFCELFNVEARLAARLNHPNIVSVTEYNRDAKGRPFLAMEYVDGVDLSRLMYGARPLPFSVVAYLAVEILRGLGYAHAPPREAGIRGLVHRDISPQNVLLSWEGAVKVSDFGIAKALTSSGVMSGSHMGKPAYMSPEQVNGDRVDHRSDLYAVGVMLWELLTGRQLFERGTAREIFARIVLGNPLRPSQVRTEVPADLEHVAMTLLQGDPAQRYARAEDAIADLIKCSSMPRHGPGELITLLAERFHRRARGANDGPVVIEQATADLAQPTASIQTLTEEALAMDAPLIPSALRPTAATPTPQLEPAPSGRAFAGVALEPVGFLGSTKRRALVFAVVVLVGAVVLVLVLAREKTASLGHRRELEPQELEPKVAAPIESSPPDRLEETRAATEDPVMSDVPAAQPTTPTRLDVRRTSTKEQLRGTSKERRKSEPTTERGMIDVKITPVKPPERTL